jgi:hypothetical protein
MPAAGRRPPRPSGPQAEVAQCEREAGLQQPENGEATPTAKVTDSTAGEHRRPDHGRADHQLDADTSSGAS